MSVRKRTLPSGEVRWLVDYKDQAGARRARQFKTQREAKAFEAKAIVEVSERTHVPRAEAVSIRQAVEKYIMHLDGRVAAGEMERRTLADIKSKLAHVTGEHGIPEVLLPDVTFAAADSMRLRLIGAGMSGANGAKVLGTLRTMMNWGVDARLVTRNDLAGRRSKRGSREKKQVPIPAAADISKLLVEADKLPAPYGLYVRTAVLTGCRAGELRGLQWRHVDFTVGTVRVEQRAEQDGTIGKPKTLSGHRTVPLPAGLLAKLKEAHFAAGRNPDSYVFGNRAGEPIDHDAFSGRHWRPLLRRLGLSGLDFHHLRHAYASMLLNAAVPVTEVSRRLGHADPSITLRIYSHALPEASAGAELAGIEASLRPRNTDAT
ncbi:site-specific integrase [Magnetospirillum sp. UT-4]|uniref:site-specific integrase n=1 Tax=Magnetospirillum sp. UT-4 TaxID=2681467 RepID=UPI0013822E80|nr:site-specific integrase [Magnetospirillum sp. UT-4]CAA7624976.1 Phage integrase [Magnetospirillum sp. UT-4]